MQESYQPYVPPCAWKSQECGSFLPLPGILRQFCLEFLAADESCTKGSASSRSRPTLRATARTQPHKFLHNFSGFSLSQHSKPSPLPPPRLTQLKEHPRGACPDLLGTSRLYFPAPGLLAGSSVLMCSTSVFPGGLHESRDSMCFVRRCDPRAQHRACWRGAEGRRTS